MKPLSWLSITLLAILISGTASAQISLTTDDSDLAPRRQMRFQAPPPVLRPDSVISDARERGLMIRFVRRQSGSVYAIEGLPIALTLVNTGNTGNTGNTTIPGETQNDGTFFIDCEQGVPVSGKAELRTSRFDVSGQRGVYSVAFEASCGTTATLVFEAASDAGQAMSIWSIARAAERKLASTVRMDFWRRPIRFSWPADGDYYSFGTVNITRGDYWDVVGHELGHAIYDLADIGALGGGMHKIDECYSDRLALSEGWASFFSAWLSVSLSDPDAKFEFMVPRRAPIRFEHVPADVCEGHMNEWRVTAFLWDLIDFNRDNETMEETFGRVWQALAGTNSRSAAEVSNFLQKAGFAPELLDLIWELNFRTKRPAR